MGNGTHTLQRPATLPEIEWGLDLPTDKKRSKTTLDAIEPKEKKGFFRKYGKWVALATAVPVSTALAFYFGSKKGDGYKMTGDELNAAVNQPGITLPMKGNRDSVRVSSDTGRIFIETYVSRQFPGLCEALDAYQGKSTNKSLKLKIVGVGKAREIYGNPATLAILKRDFPDVETAYNARLNAYNENGQELGSRLYTFIKLKNGDIKILY